MTDRLGELRPSAPSEPEDVEAGPSAAVDPKLAVFDSNADAIEKVLVWVDGSIRTITNDLSDPDALPSVAAELDIVDRKLDAVRKDLRRIADENRQMASAAESSPATLKHCVHRFTKLGNDFMAIAMRMGTVRERHRDVVMEGVKRDILAANPHATERQMERALLDSDLQAVLSGDGVRLPHQIEDMRARNQNVQELSKYVVELQNVFTDMSVLVEDQNELIQGMVEHEKDVHATTKMAEGELESGRIDQRTGRKRKACYIISVIAVVLLIAGGILVWAGFDERLVWRR